MLGRLRYSLSMARAVVAEKARTELEDAREWARLLRSVVGAGGPREWLEGLDRQDKEREDALDRALDEKRAAIDELGHITAGLADTLAPLAARLYPGPSVPVSRGGGVVEDFGPAGNAPSMTDLVTRACAALDAAPGAMGAAFDEKLRKELAALRGIVEECCESMICTAADLPGHVDALIQGDPEDKTTLRKALEDTRAELAALKREPPLDEAVKEKFRAMVQQRDEYQKLAERLRLDVVRMQPLEADNAAIRAELDGIKAGRSSYYGPRTHSPERIEQLEAENARLKSLVGQTAEARKQRAQRDEGRIKAALEHACPECGAGAKDPCTATVTDDEGKTKHPTRAPHPKRFELAFPPSKAKASAVARAPSAHGKSSLHDGKDSPSTTDGKEGPALDEAKE